MSRLSHTAQLRVFADAEAASCALAEETATEIRRAGHGGWVVGLPTGNTPLALYQAWIRLHREAALSFAAVRSFNLDEFWPAPHGASFADFMEESLFAQVDLPPAQRNLLDGRVSAVDVAAECARFEAAIRAAGGLDLQILGLGHNGHIGFNEPGSPPESRTRKVPLA
ncbi:MAG: 6-phosphogluconolactonase, partial [Planctomycetota bacterium]|nr:6-phosphogluconolactonase [Planctomycetota bacterium]